MIFEDLEHSKSKCQIVDQKRRKRSSQIRNPNYNWINGTPQLSKPVAA